MSFHSSNVIALVAGSSMFSAVTVSVRVAM